MSQEKLQAWWSKKQGLDGSLLGVAPQEVLQRIGWARSVGSSCPYLTLFSRSGTSRTEVDSAVSKLYIHELPAARNCTYVVPACDYGLALRVGQNFQGSDFKAAMKLGVTEKEIDKLCDKVAAALTKATLSPDEIKEAVGNAVRHLGDEGKKRGITNTLGIALGRLQASGIIRRVPADGRLDQQRFRYTAWAINPLSNCPWSADEAFVELARRFFMWIGPATIQEFQWFSGLGVKAAKEAIALLNLVPIEKETDRLILPDELEAFQSFKVPKKTHYSLVCSIDSMVMLRRDFSTLLSPQDLPKMVAGDKGLVALGKIADLPSHAILGQGKLVGLWEFDPESGTIAWGAFTPKNKAMEMAVKSTEAYAREQLGDVRSFSLDSPKSRRPRISALRGD